MPLTQYQRFKDNETIRNIIRGLNDKILTELKLTLLIVFKIIILFKTLSEIGIDLNQHCKFEI